MSILLETKDLHVRFRAVSRSRALLQRDVSPYIDAVAGVTFAVHQGQTYALVGESGSGKSTLARAVNRLVASEPGSYIAFDGVVGISPIVIDLLNLVPSFEHHWRAYGFWAPAVGDYVEQKIMDWSGSPQYKALLQIEEPFEYRSRYTMPKYLINATGDQFFLPDSSQFYWSELPGPKYLRYVPNADHGLGGTDVPMTLLAFYNALLNRTKLPEYSWKVDADDSIHLVTDQKPKAAKVWYAVNPDARDFRVETIGRVWKSEPIAESGDGTYIGKVDKPEKGFKAFLVELTYQYDGSPPFKVTSQVKVVPDTLPFVYKQPTPPVVAAHELGDAPGEQRRDREAGHLEAAVEGEDLAARPDRIGVHQQRTVDGQRVRLAETGEQPR